MVEIAKTQKRLNLSFVCRRFPVRNTGNFNWVHTDLSMSDNDTEVLSFSLVEGALVEIEKQLVVAKDLHHSTNLSMMFAKSLREDEDVVNVHYDLSVIDLDSENFVHHGLEGSGRICKAKEHDSGFVKTTIGSEGSLPLISLLYADIVISPSDIKLCKILGILKGVDKVGDKGWRIAVLLGDVIQSTVVLDWAKSPVLFLDKEERGGHWRV
jgi:hypothetical protein